MIENRDLAAERAVLSGIVKYGQDGLMECADILERSSFWHPTNQIFHQIFEHALKSGDVIDLPVILSTANGLGHKELFSVEDNKSLLRAILNFPPDISNLRKLAAKVKKLQVARQLRDELKQIDHDIEQITGEEPIEAIIGLAENKVFSFAAQLNSKSSEEPESIGEGLAEFKEYLLANKGKSIGIPTGFPIYDKCIGGGARAGISLIGSRIKTGKSIMANCIASHVAGKLRIPVCYLDTEMSKEEQQVRLAANIANIEIDKIEAGLFYDNPVDKANFDKAAKFIQEMPYRRINIFGKSTDSILSIIRRWLIKNVGFEDNGKAKPCLVILDYIKLMDQSTVTKNIAEHQALGFLTSSLQDFGKQYNVPFVAFAQLNRDGINQEDSGAFSGSDRIGWFVNNLSIFKKKSQEEIAEEAQIHKEFYNRKLLTIDARHGPAMDAGDYINMKMQGAFARVVEGKTREEIYATKQPTGTVVAGQADSAKRAQVDDDFHF